MNYTTLRSDAWMLINSSVKVLSDRHGNSTEALTAMEAWAETSDVMEGLNGAIGVYLQNMKAFQDSLENQSLDGQKESARLLMTVSSTCWGLITAAMCATVATATTQNCVLREIFYGKDESNGNGNSNLPGLQTGPVRR